MGGPLARDKHGHHTWVEPHQTPYERGKPNPGGARLLTILLTEAAYLIWQIRCERAIQRNNNPNRPHTQSEIENKWGQVINTRLKMDRLLTDTLEYGKRALREELVLQTWSGVLMNEQELPDNWIRATGVLVGSSPRRLRGRNR